MTRAFLFDLDGTLFDRDAAVAGVLASQVRLFRDLITPERASMYSNRVTVLDAHGHGNKRDVYATIATEFGFDASVAEQLIESFWIEYFRHCHLDTGVAATLAELRRRGFGLAIVTNGLASVQNSTVDALGVREAVDVILISETEGIRKPDSVIFHRAAEQLRVRANECCFVGDHPVVDIAGAQAAGLWAVWKRTPYWAPTTRVTTIEAIEELLSLALS